MKQTITEKFFYKIYEILLSFYRVSQKRWVFWPVITASIFLASFSYFFTIGANFTHSMPHKFYVFSKHFDVDKLKRGDVVMVRYVGHKFYPYGTKFVKVVAGLPGEKVTHIGQDVYVNNFHIGAAKLFAGPDQSGPPLDMSKPGVLPKGHYFLYTPSPDSFDSRYEYVGFEDKTNIIGKAVFAFGKGVVEREHQKS